MDTLSMFVRSFPSAKINLGRTKTKPIIIYASAVGSLLTYL